MMINNQQPKTTSIVRKVNFTYSFVEQLTNGENSLKVTYKYNDINQELFNQLYACKQLQLILPTHKPIFNQADKKVEMIFANLAFSQINFEDPHVILSIAICLADLEKRGIPITPYRHLFSNYNGIIYLNLKEFNYQLSNDSFGDFKEEFKIQPWFTNYDQFIKSQFQNLSDPPYWDIVQKMLDIKPIQLNTEGNSYIYKTPNNLKMKLKSERHLDRCLVIKSTIHKPGDQKSVLNARKEIEMMEKFDFTGSHVLTCQFYLAICDQIYIFMDELMDLKAYLESHKFQQLQDKNKVIFSIVQQFAQGLSQMHEVEIIHRDLKPENLFLNLTVGVNLLIGDFDRSKSNQMNQQNSLFQTEYHSFTDEYNPPEQHNADVPHTSKSDIWQFGFTCLVIASRKETELGKQNSSLHMHYGFPQHLEFYQKCFGEKKIQELLGSLQYKENFIKLVQQCLKYEPSERPSIDKVVEDIASLETSLFFQPQAGSIIVPQFRQRNSSISNVPKFESNFLNKHSPIRSYRPPQMTQVYQVGGQQNSQSKFPQQLYQQSAQFKANQETFNNQGNSSSQQAQSPIKTVTSPKNQIKLIPNQRIKTEEMLSNGSLDSTLEKQSQKIIINPHNNLKKTNEQLESMDKTDTLQKQQLMAKIKIINK